MSDNNTVPFLSERNRHPVSNCEIFLFCFFHPPLQFGFANWWRLRNCFVVANIEKDLHRVRLQMLRFNAKQRRGNNLIPFFLTHSKKLRYSLSVNSSCCFCVKLSFFSKSDISTSCSWACWLRSPILYSSSIAITFSRRAAQDLEPRAQRALWLARKLERKLKIPIEKEEEHSNRKHSEK